MGLFDWHDARKRLPNENRKIRFRVEDGDRLTYHEGDYEGKRFVDRINVFKYLNEKVKEWQYIN